jgi:potassium-transporting ATPase KdpC subunit
LIYWLPFGFREYQTKKTKKMKQHILPALRLTLVTILLFCVLYTAFIWAIAQFSPAKGEGEKLMANGAIVGYALEGQSFTKDKYFWSRPSAAAYNAAGSSGSNKGPSNPDYLKDVQSRIDSFLIHNPGVNKDAIPAEMVTASGSGLDPDISPESAYVQVARIAKERKLSEEKINSIIQKHIQQPLLGLFGPSKINLLAINIELDKLH